MFKPLSLYIGLRYTRAKKCHYFVSLVTCFSILGIALGVMVLITVLSVMNGFDYEIRNHIFHQARHITIEKRNGAFTDWKPLSEQLKKNDDIKAIAPFFDGQAVLSVNGKFFPLLLTGVLPSLEGSISSEKPLNTGGLMHLIPGHFGILLSQSLAYALRLKQGDKVMVMIPQASWTPAGVLPRFKRFTLCGFLNVGSSESRSFLSMAKVHLKDAQALYGKGSDVVSGLRLRVGGLYIAPTVASYLRKKLPNTYKVRDWTEHYGAFFKALSLQKTMLFLILFLIILIALFNLIASLVMVVNDKQEDIAILGTLGANPYMILRIFMVQGLAIGVVGTALGVTGGVLLSLHAGKVAHLLEQLLHTHFISAQVYGFNFLPSKLMAADVIWISSMTMLLSFLATCYPAWRAMTITPVEALRYA